MSSITGNLWTIVLAAGEGKRLRPLTRLLHGEELPKQFAMIQPGRSLLQSTLERTARFCPAERTVVVVARDREALARSQLGRCGPVEMIVQPANLGTGPGILLPLTQIATRAPDALVAIVPSDHFVQDAEPFAATMRQAADVAMRDDTVVLVGAVPDRAESEYGWIVPSGEPVRASARVARFHEKPPVAMARRLLRAGALWNTFLMVAPAARLLELARRHMPEQSKAFEAYGRALEAGPAGGALEAAYDSMMPADFSRDVLERADALRVVPLAPCGWSDWGTPERVLTSLRGSADYASLFGRLRGSSREVGIELQELVSLTRQEAS